MRVVGWNIAVLLILLLVAATWAQDGFDEDLPGMAGGGFDGYDGMGYGGGDPYDPYGAMEPRRPVKDLSTMDDIDLFLKEDDYEPSVVGYFDPETHAEELEGFKEMAEAMGAHYRFGIVTDRSILESKKYDGAALIVYPPVKFVNEKMERTKSRYPGKNIVFGEALEQFVVTKSLPLVGLLDGASEKRYQAANKPMVIVYADVDLMRNPKGFAYFANRLRKVAKEHRDIIFAVADVDDRMVEAEMDFGFEDLSSKSVVVGLRDGQWFYKMHDSFSTEAVETFIQAFRSGQLVGKEKVAPSADTSDSWDGSAVVQLSGANFEAEVFDSHADAFVMFYAPWCGHCQSLKPEYKQAAEHFQGDATVKFAAFDATAHSVPLGFEVEGYPTLYFVPAGSRQPQPYDGPREAAALVQFVKKHRKGVAGGDL